MPRSAIVLALFVTQSLLAADWQQFGGNARHTGTQPVLAQPLKKLYADIVYDPFVEKEMAATNGALYTHFQVPLVDADGVYMEFKSGTYVDNAHWETQNWSIHGLRWENGTLADKWTAPSDWKPVPAGGAAFFEPVFHSVLANGYLYMPGAGATLLQLDRRDGHVVKRINPFGASIETNTYMSGVPAADPAGNIYYGAIRFDPAAPWGSDIAGAWLVRVAADGTPAAVPFASLVPNAPKATDQCTTAFDRRTQPRPWPPAPDAVAPTAPCGSVRPGINAAPAIAADGTVYFVGHSNFNPGYSFLLAVKPDLTSKWSASLRNIFNDGCGVLIPFGTAASNCRQGATAGVDPNDNQRPSGRVIDDATSSPVALPDGTVLYGTYTNYNGARGHMVRYSADGQLLKTYDFGWDTTPAVWQHDGTYSIITKENHYAPPQAYLITQLDPNLNVEWQFKSTNTQACGRTPSGTIDCVDDQPYGFEWCVNAPAVDSRGTVYVNSEDGRLYAIGQGGVEQESIFLQLALGAGYTPVSIGPDGRLYAQNAGHLFAVGGTWPRRRAAR